jgi:hypothetical protein
MIELSYMQAERACRALLEPERASALIEYWQLAFPEGCSNAASVLVIASVIASGSQEPSATTALSVAQGIVDKQTGQTLLLTGLALEAFAEPEVMTDAIQHLVGEGLQSVYEKFLFTLNQSETNYA